jgi:hypothetical protein
MCNSSLRRVWETHTLYPIFLKLHIYVIFKTLVDQKIVI